MRIARHSDIPSIVELAKRFNEDAGKVIPFESVCFSVTVANYISSENCCAFVTENDSKVVGCLLGACSPYPAASLIQANELIWYCKKQNRGRGSIKLFNAYTNWAVSKGASLIYAGAYDRKASSFYERKGFSMVDENWVKVI